MTGRPIVRSSILLTLSLVLSCWATCAANARIRQASDLTESTTLVVAETVDSLTYRTSDNTQLRLRKHPRRTVVLLTSLLDLWYQAGGTAVGRCAGETNVPAEARDLPILGTFANPNVEKILSLQPDLVVSSDVGAFRAMIPILQANSIDYALVSYVDYTDYLALIDLFGKLNGSEKHCRQVTDRIASQIAACIAAVPVGPRPKVLIVFTSPNMVNCEPPDSQTGCMARMLGAENIIASAATDRSTRVNFSLERIVLLDPDLVLINTMGQVQACKERLDQELAGNSAWSALRAVRQGQVHYLPKSLFLYKPNHHYPDAFRYLAALLYPQVFKMSQDEALSVEGR